MKLPFDLQPNQVRITLVSFLAYFIMSGMLSPIGIISGPMAEHFGLPVTDVTAKFSWLTLGILVGSTLALVAFDLLKLKYVMLLVYVVLGIALGSMLMSGELDLIGIALGAVGVGCGVGLAGAASIISSTYSENLRASMLVITDGCFSIAGVVCSYVAIYLIAQQFHWAGVYGFVGLVAVVVVVLVVISDFPEFAKNTGVSDGGVWPLGVWLCIGALFLYTLGQYSLLWWLPNYLETALQIPAAQAGETVGRFWSGMFCAQLFVAWWVLRIGVNRLVLIAAVTTALGSIPLWMVPDIDYLVVLAFVWGCANLGLLKIIISFGSLMLKEPSPRLISALLLGATTGTAVSPFITSQIVELSSSLAVLQFGTGCYVLLCLLVLVASRVRPVQAPANASVSA